MAAAQILAIGSAETPSGDVVVVTGTPLTVCLKDADGPVLGDAARVEIQLKADNAEYFWIDTLTAAKPAVVISGPGTYRFVRKAGTCGVFSG